MPVGYASAGWAPPVPAREDVRPDERVFYDRLLYRLGEISVPGPGGQGEGLGGPYFEALLTSPPIGFAHRELGSYYRSRGEFPGSFTHAQREWVDAVLGKEIGWNFEHHIGDGLAHGIRPEAIRAVYEGNEEEVFNAEERQLAEYIRAVANGRVTAELYKRLEQLMGVRGAVEYTAFIAYLMLTARCIQAFGSVPVTDEAYMAVLDDYVSGRRPLPDPMAKIPTLDIQPFASPDMPLGEPRSRAKT